MAAGLTLLLSTTTVACSSKSDSGAADAAVGTTTPPAGGGTPTDPGTGTTTPPATTPTPAGTCAKSVIKILFAPMYTAFDGGMHQFQVPAVVDGLDSTAVMWSASDPTMVGLQADATTGGVMITALKAGELDIIATAGTICGISHLTIDQAVADDWNAGNMRYNNGVTLVRAPRDRDAGVDGRPMGGGLVATDGGTTDRVACTTCHGPTANGPYKTVSHTPEQIGGFSDAQLMMIFNGIWPTSGNAFDPAIIDKGTWQRIHKWNMTADEAAGVIIYLRALTPAPQTGMRNFGGRGPGGFRGDGGPPDAGAPVDAPAAD